MQRRRHWWYACYVCYACTQVRTVYIRMYQDKHRRRIKITILEREGERQKTNICLEGRQLTSLLLRVCMNGFRVAMLNKQVGTSHDVSVDDKWIKINYTSWSGFRLTKQQQRHRNRWTDREKDKEKSGRALYVAYDCLLHELYTREPCLIYNMPLGVLDLNQQTYSACGVANFLWRSQTVVLY